MRHFNVFDNMGEVLLAINAIAARDDTGFSHNDAAQNAWVYILDRYGEIYARLPDDGKNTPITASAILEWLQYMEIRCSI